ncbi:MAG TPA: transglycosylase SLT domain-containing protein, partial [Chryseolinea sp.]|nr:transglycosylase SLT domain-containing protein [Chryseolinea sp.]
MTIQTVVVSFLLGGLVFACSRPTASEPGETVPIEPVSNIAMDSVFPAVTPFLLKHPPATLRQPLVKKKLRVLTLHSVNSFFLYDGEEHGLEYELLQLYAKHADMLIDIVTVENYKQMYDSIALGNFDLAMGTLFINSAMDSITPFSNPLYYSDIVLATGMPEKLEVSVRYPSAHVIQHSPLHFWMKDNDSIQNAIDSIRHLDLALSKELALERVAKLEFSGLLVDKHDLLIMHSYFPQLKEHTIIQEEQPVGFAFNPHSQSLRDHFNAWHAKKRQSIDYLYTIKKYDDHSAFVKEKLKYEMPLIREGIISKYDSLIRRHATKEAFDWKLIAAIIHQESRFRPHIVSPVGAYGLMQLMPSVAKTYKINFRSLASPDLNIALGTKYFRWIYNHFDKPEFTEEDKIKFSLASYNAGIGHVHDARALARKYKMNPNVWSDNVEVMLLNKGSRQYYTDPVVK